jgi:hypothetical protein
MENRDPQPKIQVNFIIQFPASTPGVVDNSKPASPDKKINIEELAEVVKNLKISMSPFWNFDFF